MIVDIDEHQDNDRAGGSTQDRISWSLTSRDNRDIRILSLDGGGARGIVQLLTLKRIFNTDTLRHVKPCQFFDLIAGTSTGGIVAVLLGKLQLTINQAIEAFDNLIKKVYKPLKFSAYRYDVRLLEFELKRIIANSDVAPPLDPEIATLRTAADHCQVVIAARRSAFVDANPKLFCSYNLPHSENDCDTVPIWQAIRATCADQRFFESIVINGVRYIDGGLLSNNPCVIAIRQAQLLFPGKQIGVVYTLGTGIARPVEAEMRTSFSSIVGRVKSSRLALAQVTELPYSSRFEHQEASRICHTDLNAHYVRFDPPFVGDIEVDGHGMEKLRDFTEAYLDDSEQQMQMKTSLCRVFAMQRQPTITPLNHWFAREVDSRVRGFGAAGSDHDPHLVTQLDLLINALQAEASRRRGADHTVLRLGGHRSSSACSAKQQDPAEVASRERRQVRRPLPVLLSSADSVDGRENWKICNELEHGQKPLPLQCAGPATGSSTLAHANVNRSNADAMPADLSEEQEIEPPSSREQSSNVYAVTHLSHTGSTRTPDLQSRHPPQQIQSQPHDGSPSSESTKTLVVSQCTNVASTSNLVLEREASQHLETQNLPQKPSDPLLFGLRGAGSEDETRSCKSNGQDKQIDDKGAICSTSNDSEAVLLSLWRQSQDLTPAISLPSSGASLESRRAGTVCPKCKQTLKGDFVRAMGEVFHLDCFRCQDCDVIVASKFFQVNGPDGGQYPLCETDYFRRLDLLCCRCGLALRGSYVTAVDMKFHAEHFTCSVCPTIFGTQDSYYEHGGQVYCDFHYSACVAVKCPGCEAAILKQFVEVKKDDGDEHWHPDCYMIYKFWNIKLGQELETGTTTEAGTSKVEAPRQPEKAKPAGETTAADALAAGFESAERTASSFLEKQKMTEARAHQFWTVLSTFEESVSACLAGIFQEADNGREDAVIDLAFDFLLHVETLFAAIDDLKVISREVGAKDMPHVREARALCNTTIGYLAFFRHWYQSGHCNANTVKEQLSRITRLAHYLKLSIRIVMTWALRLDSKHAAPSAVSQLLGRLDRLCGDPSPEKVDCAQATSFAAVSGAGIEEGTTARFPRKTASIKSRACGYESLFESRAFSWDHLDREKAEGLCENCHLAIEEDCVRFGTHLRWHVECLICSVCQRSASVWPDDLAKLTPLDGQGQHEVGEKPNKPPMHIKDFRLDSYMYSSPHKSGALTSVVIVYCSGCPSIFGRNGFEYVTRLEQYSYLLYLALSRLRHTIKRNVG